MLNKLLNIKSKYEDISTIYNIQDICDEYILLKNKELYQVYIYEVFPVNVTNLQEEQKEYIIEKYIEFLKKVNIDFQILVRTNKFDVDEYVKNIEERINANECKKEGIYKEYIENMKYFLVNQDIYILYYYIIAKKSQNDTNNIESMIYSIENTGCKVNKMFGKEKLYSFIYENINKVELRGDE